MSDCIQYACRLDAKLSLAKTWLQNESYQVVAVVSFCRSQEQWDTGHESFFQSSRKNATFEQA
jgi:hypothetical protein